uniref:Uncharacterized protein n=1 Tax=Arundo donax TaxID=35708 RepID=A0A0A9HNG2_ARUDO
MMHSGAAGIGMYIQEELTPIWAHWRI